MHNANSQNELPLEEAPITCWCGAQGTYEELFDDSGLPPTCGGLGTLHCECGGDQCVCHHHGEVDCVGCEDCDEFDDWYDGDEFDDWYDDEMEDPDV